jgi:hypothetical protein
MVPKKRRPRNTGKMFIAGPQTVLSLPGQEYAQLPSPSRGRSPVPGLRKGPFGAAATPAPSEVHVADLYGPMDDFDVIEDIFTHDGPEPESLKRQKQQHKKVKQWKKWTEDVIPSMLRPHLHLLHKSESLRTMLHPTKPQCACHGSSHRLRVVCVSFESECHVCSCGLAIPASVQS